LHINAEWEFQYGFDRKFQAFSTAEHDYDKSSFNIQYKYPLMSYAIATMSGEHLGFVLVQGNSNSGDSIVRFLPKDAKQFDIQSNKSLMELTDKGELSWSLSNGVITGKLSDEKIGFTIINGVMTVGKDAFKAVKLQ
jgi:hypothetical protein